MIGTNQISSADQSEFGSEMYEKPATEEGESL